MKKINLLLVAGALISVVACQKDQEKKDHGKGIGNLHLSTAYPKAGDSLNLSYKVTGEDSDDLQAYFYYLVDQNIYPEDLSLQDSADIREGRVFIPDSATAIAFDFKTGDSFDVNDQLGFVQPLYDSKDEMLLGSGASVVHFYQRRGEQTGIALSNDSLTTLMEQDFKDHPKVQEKWDGEYASILYANDRDEAQEYVSKRLKVYNDKKKLSEENFNTLSSFYSMGKMDKKLDSINKLATKKYPKGKSARMKALMDFHKEQDPAKKEELFQQYEENIGRNGFEKDFMLNDLASMYLEDGNVDKYREYSEKMSDQTQIASSYNNAAWNMAEDGKDLDKAAEISKKSLELIKNAEKDLSKRPQQYTKSAYKKNLTNTYQSYADTYAYILFKQGNVKEALKYQKEAVGNGESNDVNDRYVQYLVANKDFTKAQQKATDFIKENKSGNEMEACLKEAFVANKGSEDGYPDYLEKLEKEASQQRRSDLKEAMLNKDAFDFRLKDLDGNNVSLADLKGKTVILDFWATWCGPCKASFPGMQTAVEKYKDDPSVAFYFVDTFERGKLDARNKSVSQFIEKNEYPFDVLMDVAKEGNNEFETASDYGITAIPAKIIIGPNGKWLFTKTGFSGSNKQLVQEIDMMIELSKS